MRYFLGIFLVAFWAVASFAQEKPPLPDYASVYVNDFAGVIDADREAEIEAKLKRIKETYDVEMSVLTIESRTDYSHQGSWESFATAVFNAWGVGNAERNDGILLMVATKDRDIRIELGSGYPPVYDNDAKRVIDRFMVDKFRAGDFSRGFKVAIDELEARLGRSWRGEGPSVLKRWMDDIIKYLIFLIFGLVIMLSWFGDRISDFSQRFKTCPNCGSKGLRRGRETTQQASYSTTGRQILTTRCPHCGYVDTETRVLPIKSRSSGGGGGSFGGGGSSGGGASGRF